ncbi:MAG: sigma-70 family RNA polymerase sigma factor [Bacteroidota bacterium]|jgi:RNA polymerase sigma-70 factor (ECF subfamily)|nr:sigma-70 family RNA polymerase sigma factor [Bacteroidota bacterium]|tara:strand:- start:3820 stop:4413 length:594 start_codon:yes stop_codon:yes gene_type:complete
MYASKSDEFLIQQFRSGNNTAFDILLKRYQSKVFSYIMQLVKDHDLANDIFQEVFIKVVINLKKESYHHEGKLLSWILRISHNQVIDHFRKSSKMPYVGRSSSNPDFDIFSVLKLEDSSIEDVMINDQILKDVRLLIHELPQDQKEVVKMRFFMKMSFKEIAEKTGVSINTSLGRMRYALINLRKLIDEKQLVLTHG